MGIVSAPVDRVDQLPDDKDRRDAGVVVNVLLPFLQDRMSGGVEHFHVVARLPEDAHQHGKVIREHLRRQNGILLRHFLGKQQTAVFVIY